MSGERRVGNSVSGWCSDGHHRGCRYVGCPCECHRPVVIITADGITTEAGS